MGSKEEEALKKALKREAVRVQPDRDALKKIQERIKAQGGNGK